MAFSQQSSNWIAKSLVLHGIRDNRQLGTMNGVLRDRQRFHLSQETANNVPNDFPYS